MTYENSRELVNKVTKTTYTGKLTKFILFFGHEKKLNSITKELV